MAGTNPWKGADCDFNYTRQDDTPIVFNIVDAAGVAVSNAGRTYLLEGDTEPRPTNEDNQVFSLTGVAGGASGTITFNPTGGASGTFGTTAPDVIFYNLIETISSREHTKVRGAITLDPRIADKGVV